MHLRLPTLVSYPPPPTPPPPPPPPLSPSTTSSFLAPTAALLAPSRHIPFNFLHPALDANPEEAGHLRPFYS